jgi:hypothetical protein
VLQVRELIVRRKKRVELHQGLAAIQRRQLVVGHIEKAQAQRKQLERADSVVGDVEADQLSKKLEVAAEAQRVEGAVEVADLAEENVFGFGRIERNWIEGF